MTETPDADRLPSLAGPRGWVVKWLVRAVALGLFCLVSWRLSQMDPADLRNALPDSPLFLAVLLAMYFSVPAADWLIFRRLWKLPIEGFPILVGKRISNELLLAYSGEAYFYLWARKRAGLTGAPFAVIRDVNILSAVVGNAATLVLVLAAWPLMPNLHLGGYEGPVLASAALMLTVSFGILFLNRRLFVLTRRETTFVCMVHLVRLIIGVVLSASLWNLAVPTAPLGLWMTLALVRLLISRLPLVPNTELMFAAAALVIAGKAGDVAAAVSLTSGCILLLHLVFGAVLALWCMLAGGRGRVWGSGAPTPQAA